MSNRDHIIEEAKKLFRHKGYAAVSMADVVKACGVTKPTIYHYFGDKEGLYTEMLIEILSKGASYIAPTVSRTMPFKEKLVKLAVGYFENSPTAVATLVRDSAVHLSPANLGRINQAMQFYMHSPFVGIFTAAIDNGELSDDNDAEELATMYLTFLDTFTALHRTKHGRSKDFNPIAKSMVSRFFEGIS